MRTQERKKIRCQIFLEKRNNEPVWVPYKTLIGYGPRTRVVQGGRGEALYTWREFANRRVAVDEAKKRALDAVHLTFPHARAEDIEWDIVHENTAGLVEAR